MARRRTQPLPGSPLSGGFGVEHGPGSQNDPRSPNSLADPGDHGEGIGDGEGDLDRRVRPHHGQRPDHLHEPVRSSRPGPPRRSRPPGCAPGSLRGSKVVRSSGFGWQVEPRKTLALPGPRRQPAEKVPHLQRRKIHTSGDVERSEAHAFRDPSGESKWRASLRSTLPDVFLRARYRAVRGGPGGCARWCR